MKQGDDIEDRFMRAVGLALKKDDVVKSSSAAIIEPVQKGARRRCLGQWRITLLYMVLTATLAFIVVAALLE